MWCSQATELKIELKRIGFSIPHCLKSVAAYPRNAFTPVVCWPITKAPPRLEITAFNDCLRQAARDEDALPQVASALSKGRAIQSQAFLEEAKKRDVINVDLLLHLLQNPKLSFLSRLQPSLSKASGVTSPLLMPETRLIFPNELNEHQ